MCLISQQWERQIVFVGELLLFRRGVGTDADDGGRSDLSGDVTKKAGLLSTTRRVSLWVEVHENLASFELGQRDFLTRLIHE